MRIFSFFTDVKLSAKFHAISAFIWLGIGVFGLVQYVNYLKTNPDPEAFSPIAGSIPILFFISVWALMIGHWGTFQTIKGEQAQIQKIDEIDTQTDPPVGNDPDKG